MTPARPDLDATADTLAGLVVAGGYSTRFGEDDKAVADLAGTPMIRRVVDRLAAITDAVVVNCRDDQLATIEDVLVGCEPSIRFATDPVENRGPVEGIRVGLDAVDREYTAVVACDMPFVDPALLRRLVERARECDADGAVVQLEGGWYQTTQAVYRTDTMAQACGEALDGDDRRILAAIDRLDCETVDEDALDDWGIDDATFESIDTREALTEAADRVG